MPRVGEVPFPLNWKIVTCLDDMPRSEQVGEEGIGNLHVTVRVNKNVSAIRGDAMLLKCPDVVAKPAGFCSADTMTSEEELSKLNPLNLSLFF